MNCEFGNIDKDQIPISNDQAADIQSLVEQAKTNRYSVLKRVNRQFDVTVKSIPQLNEKQYIWLKYNLEDYIKQIQEKEAAGDEFIKQRVNGKDEQVL